MTSLSTSFTLPCGVTLGNRIAKAAMTEGLADPYSRATGRLATLYQTWAKGGSGLLLTGNVMMDRRFMEAPGNVAIDGPQDADQMKALSAWAKAATDENCHIWPQLSHAGRQVPKTVSPEPVGPSASTLAIPGGQFAPSRALTVAEIEDIIARFANAARVSKEAGFTGVQIHGAHGYLLSSFLNPRVNQRDDEWGGSLENRARLLIRTVRAVREAVGPSFPVAVKLNSSDFQKGGFTLEECVEVVRWLNDEGLDLLEISGGNYEQPKLLDIEGLEPAEEAPGLGVATGEKDTRQESTKQREGYFLAYAEAVRKVAQMPLMVTGGFRSRDVMEGALAAGTLDMVGLGRPLCVEPDIVARLLGGEVTTAPSWEKSLRMGPGPFGPNSPLKTVRVINAFGAQTYFYVNIARMGDGLAPKKQMALFPAFLGYQSGEQKKAKRLVR